MIIFFCLALGLVTPVYAQDSAKKEELSEEILPTIIEGPPKRVFHDILIKDFAIRTIGRLRVRNPRGLITIKGWSQDKIRVRARREVQEVNRDMARSRLNALSIHWVESGGNVEVGAEYGKGLSVRKKIQERRDPTDRMHFEIWAPGNLDLEILGRDQPVLVTQWSGEIELRSRRGDLQVDRASSKNIHLNCSHCPMVVKNTSGKIRMVSHSGRVRLIGVKGKEIFVETQSGSIDLENVEGGQIYVSKTGPIIGQDLRGSVIFRSENGRVNLAGTRARLSGLSQSGSIEIQIDRWVDRNRAVIESQGGDVRVEIPKDFSGEIDLRAPRNRIAMDIPATVINELDIPGLGVRQITSRIGNGTDQLRVVSEKGLVSLSRTQ